MKNILSNAKSCMYIDKIYEFSNIVAITFCLDVSIRIDCIVIHHIHEIIIINDGILIRDTDKNILYNNDNVCSIDEFDYLPDFKDTDDSSDNVCNEYDESDIESNKIYSIELFKLHGNIKSILLSLYGEFEFRIDVYIKSSLLNVDIKLFNDINFKFKSDLYKFNRYSLCTFEKRIVKQFNVFVSDLCDEDSDIFNEEFCRYFSSKLIGDN